MVTAGLFISTIVGGVIAAFALVRSFVKLLLGRLGVCYDESILLTTTKEQTMHILTTTKEQTMRVHVLGPNLRDQSKGSFHVHAEGCVDVKRSREYRGRDFAHDRTTTYEVASLVEVAAEIYQDMISEDSPAESYVDEFYVFPCAVQLPEVTQKKLAERAVAAIFESPESSSIVLEASVPVSSVEDSPAKASESPVATPEWFSGNMAPGARYQVSCAFGASAVVDTVEEAGRLQDYLESICLGHHEIVRV